MSVSAFSGSLSNERKQVYESLRKTSLRYENGADVRWKNLKYSPDSRITSLGWNRMTAKIPPCVSEIVKQTYNEVISPPSVSYSSTPIHNFSRAIIRTSLLCDMVNGGSCNEPHAPSLPYPLFLNPTVARCTMISAFWMSSSGISVTPISFLIWICSDNSWASTFISPLALSTRLDLKTHCQQYIISK